MNATLTREPAATVSPRQHPALREMFRASESRHFDDEELAAIERQCPERALALAAAREIREKDVAVIGRVVKEIFSQYPYEGKHEFHNPKCIRDVRYVVAYACHAMIADDPKWLDDKLLIWLKTILQAFGFPDRQKSAATALFADRTMEMKVAGLPIKAKSIYQTYYRLKQEMGKELAPEHYALIAPYLEQAVQILPATY